MKLTILYEIFGNRRDLLPVVVFLFHGLQSLGYQVEILPPDDIHQASGDFLLLEKERGEILMDAGRKNLVLLKKEGFRYTLSLPVLKRNYHFSLGPHLDFFKPLEEDLLNETSPLKILILWLNGNEKELASSLQGLEMIADSLPPFQGELLFAPERPTLSTSLSMAAFHHLELSSQNLLEKYNGASLCLGLVPRPFFLQEVLACKTPVISIGEKLHPRIPSVSAQPRDIAVISLQIIKLGQISSRLAQNGRAVAQEDNASSHLSAIVELLLEQKKRARTLSEGEEGGENLSPMLYAQEFEEGLYNTSVVLRKTLHQILEFFQGRRRGPG